MALRVIFLVQFGIAGLFGLMFFLIPKKAMTSFVGEVPDDRYAFLTRIYGTANFMWAVAAWFAAFMPDSAGRRGIAIAFAVSLGAGVFVLVPGVIRKTLTAFGWLPTVLQTVFTVLYIYFAVTMIV